MVGFLGSHVAILAVIGLGTTKLYLFPEVMKALLIEFILVLRSINPYPLISVSD